MPINTDTHSDAPHDNPRYDPDEDGLVESLDAETVEDLVAGFVDGGTNVTVTYDDAADTLTIDADGTAVDVEDDGTLVVGGASAMNFGPNIDVVDDGDGTVTISLASSIDVDSVSTEKGSIGIDQKRRFIASDEDAQSIIENAGSGDVFVMEPGGTWDYTPPFTIPDGVAICHGGGSTQYAPQTDNLAVFVKAGNGRVTVNRRVKIGRGVAFDGQKATYTGDGLYIPGDVGHERIGLNCVINNMAGDGLVTEGLYDSHLHQTAITTCDGAGIHFSGAGSSHNSQIGTEWVWIADCGEGIVYDDEQLMSTRITGTIANCSGPGIHVTTAFDGGNSFSGSIANNDGPGMYVDTAAVTVPFHFPVRMNGNGQNVTITGDATVGDIHFNSGGVSLVCFGADFRSPGSGVNRVIVNAGESNLRVYMAAGVSNYGTDRAEVTGTGRLGVVSLNGKFQNGNAPGCEGMNFNALGETITALSDGSTI